MRDYFDNIFCENIKALKDSNGYSQEDLAAYLQVNRSLVGAWMEGRACPQTEVKVRICLMFGVDFKEMHFVKIKNRRPIRKGRPKICRT